MEMFQYCWRWGSHDYTSDFWVRRQLRWAPAENELGTSSDATQPQHYTQQRNSGRLDVVVSWPSTGFLDYAALVASPHARVAVILRTQQSYLTKLGSAMLCWVRDLARTGRVAVIDDSTRASVGQWLIIVPAAASLKRLRPGVSLLKNV
jgi:hypothetical protein